MAHLFKIISLIRASIFFLLNISQTHYYVEEIHRTTNTS
uniref:Uncharacterized protein n=1 Tax=Arundo donax TaxID=35708 RepID=A0A0A9BE31_ARUDO